MGAPRRKAGRSWTFTSGGSPAPVRHFEPHREPVDARPGLAVVDAPAPGYDALAGLVDRLEAALARLEAIGGAGASLAGAVEPVAGKPEPVRAVKGGLKFQLITGEFVPVEALAEDEPGLPGEAELTAEYGAEDLGWQDDGLGNYRAASRAVPEAVRTQLRLHGELSADDLAAALADQFGCSDGEYDLLYEAVISCAESDFGGALEGQDTDSGGRAYSWRVIEPVEVCQACGIRSLRQISGDAPNAWRYMVGHWLYGECLKHKGMQAAQRSYGEFAGPVDWDKRRDWVSRGSRGAAISSGLKARALVQGAANA